MEKENNDSLFSGTNPKVIYSLSFILILWSLKNFIISWFPENFLIPIFKRGLSVDNILNIMILILFVSIYLYGVNYVIQNPLNKFRKIISQTASILWFIFFTFPIYILIYFVVNNIYSNPEILAVVLSVISVIISFLLTNFTRNQSIKVDLLIIDKQIENLKIMKVGTGMSSEYLRNYFMLELIIKKILISKLELPIEYDKTINLFNATNVLSKNNLIGMQTKTEIEDVLKIRNKIVHKSYLPSQKEINKAKELVKKLE